MNKKNRKKLLFSALVFASLALLQGIYYLRIIASRHMNFGLFEERSRIEVQSLPNDCKGLNEKIDISGFSRAAVYRYFNEIVLNDEGRMMVDTIRKWNSPVYFFAAGNPATSDREIYRELFSQMNLVRGFPGIFEVTSIDDANFVVYFYDDEEFEALMTENNTYKKCAGVHILDIDELSGAICNGMAAVRNSMKDERRHSVICEEIVQAMGLQNDSEKYTDSLFYVRYKEEIGMNELDWILFRLLYHPMIQNKMNYSQCVPIFSVIIQK